MYSEGPRTGLQGPAASNRWVPAVRLDNEQGLRGLQLTNLTSTRQTPRPSDQRSQRRLAVRPTHAPS